jgi:K+-sensing histidine kinase KdpD
LFTTKTDGVGAGLSLCRSMIENHVAPIWASPGASGKSIFYFKLPTKNGEG